MVLATTQIELSEHAKERLTERFPGWTEEQLIALIRKSGRVPGTKILKKINSKSARLYGVSSIRFDTTLAMTNGRFYLVVERYQLVFVMCSDRAGHWAVVTFWHYGSDRT